MPNTPEEIGQLIKQIRKEKGLTQAELGSRLGVDKTTITSYEKGRNNFTVITLQKIATALGSELKINIL